MQLGFIRNLLLENALGRQAGEHAEPSADQDGFGLSGDYAKRGTGRGDVLPVRESGTAGVRDRRCHVAHGDGQRRVRRRPARR